MVVEWPSPWFGSFGSSARSVLPLINTFFYLLVFWRSKTAINHSGYGLLTLAFSSATAQTLSSFSSNKLGSPNHLEFPIDENSREGCARIHQGSVPDFYSRFFVVVKVMNGWRPVIFSLCWRDRVQLGDSGYSSLYQKNELHGFSQSEGQVLS